MYLLDWLTKRRKPISRMTRQELRRQELLLDKERRQLLNRVERLTKDKQQIFERGGREKAPELRRVLAQEFELKTSEQLMLARQLNIRSKEMLTVSRLRMLRENAERAALHGDRVGMISEADILRLANLIERDDISAGMYQERLDEVLRLGAEVDEGLTGLSESGQTVMKVWEQMDTGVIRDGEEAFEEADRQVREQQQAASGE
jgi:hypothetical protein